MVEDMLSGGRRGRPFHVSDGVILDNFPITRPFEERAYRCEQCARSDGGALRRLIDQGCDLAASDRRHGFLAQGGDCIDFKEAPRFRPALIILAVHRQITLRHIFKRGRSQFAPHLTLGASGILTGSYPSKLDLGQLAGLVHGQFAVGTKRDALRLTRPSAKAILHEENLLSGGRSFAGEAFKLSVPKIAICERAVRPVLRLERVNSGFGDFSRGHDYKRPCAYWDKNSKHQKGNIVQERIRGENLTHYYLVTQRLVELLPILDPAAGSTWVALECAFTCSSLALQVLSLRASRHAQHPTVDSVVRP